MNAIARLIRMILLLQFPSEGGSQDSPEDRAVLRYALRIGVPLWILALGGFLTILAFGAQHGFGSLGQWMRSTAALVALATASALVGAMIGFLFGIPRIRPANGAATAGGAVVAAAPNGPETYTHLEDISDWLAKILVGVGLAELSGFPTRLWSIAGILAAEFHGAGSSGNAGPLQAFVLFLMLAYGVLGLMGGFLFTRLFLRRIYHAADTYTAADVRSVDDLLQIDTMPIDKILQDKDKAFESLPAEIQSATRRMSGVSADSLHTVEELRAWAKAHLLLQDFGRAVHGYEKAVGLAPTDPMLKSDLARVRTLAARVWQRESLAEASEAAGSKDTRASASATETLMFNALYEPPPGGFERAIALGEPLRAKGGLSDRALVYLIAAYAQQSKWAAEKTDAKVQATARDRALELSRLVLPRGGEAADLLRYLWDTKDPTDDDLHVFRNDPDFVALFQPAP